MRVSSDLKFALSRCGLFRGFDDARLDALSDAAEDVKFGRGILIIREGDPGDAMFVVLAGAVQVYTHNQEGREVVLARLESGDFFGEQALLPGGTGRRNASVRTAEESTLARIPKRAFQSALAHDDALRERLLEIGAEQVRSNLQQLSPLARGIGLESVATLRRTLTGGEVLFRQGDEADALYFVTTGRLSAWREENGERTRIGSIDRGGCVGELALVRKDRRSATVAADEPSEVVAVPRTAFDAVYHESATVREHLSTLQRAYEFPQRGIVTQHAGTFAGHDCVTTLYHLQDGRVFAAYRVLGETLYTIERLGAGQTEIVTWTDEGRSRELRVDVDGIVVGLTAHGEWLDVHLFHLFVLDGGRVGPAERQEFVRSGWFDLAATGVVSDVVCHCVHVTGEKLRSAISQGATTFTRLQQATGCGTVCGGCIPVVAEMLGAEEWITADVVAEREEAPDIRSFDLVPRQVSYPEALPGQHVVVEGLVSGMRVRRPYTLSSAAEHGGRLRITVKREDNGAFSSWLFNQRKKDQPLRITRPRGEYVVTFAERPAICLVAGIGVTPAMAAAQTIAANGKAAKLFIHYSGRSRDRMAFIRELESMAGPNIETVVRETAHEGRIDMAEVAGIARRFPGSDWYLCGSPAYLDDTKRLVCAAGVPDSKIHIEAFTPIGSPVATAASAEDRAAVKRYLLVPPQPKPRGLAARALRRFGKRIVAIANSCFTNWRVAGLQLNPFRVLENRLARAARLDPKVPLEYMAIASALSWGPFEYQLRGLERHGDTFTYWLPAAPFPKFPKSCAVDTGWTRPGPGTLIPIYVTRNRAAIEYLLRRPDHTDRGALPYHYVQQMLGRMDMQSCPAGHKAGGLFAGQYHDNATWSKDRKLASDMFTFPVIDQFTTGMAAAAEEVCADIDESIAQDPDMVIDLNVLLSKVAYTIVIRAVFGNVDLAEMHALGRSLSESLRRLFEYLWEFVTGRQSVPAEYVESHQIARATINRMIDLLRELDSQGKLTDVQRNSPVIRRVLETDGEPGGAYDQLFALMFPLIIAGHETTGHTMSWGIYEMVRHPKIESAVLDEIRNFRIAHGGQHLTTADYDERPRSFALLAECLRLHAPIQATPRTPLHDGEVPPDPETGASGFRFPAGAMVVCSIAGVHLDPSRWPDPYAFRPERWMEGVNDNMTLSEKGQTVRNEIRAREQALDWLPFSDGPGRCPGQHFNAHEFLLVLDALLPRYRFELVHPEVEVLHNEAMVMGPEAGRLAVRIRPRKPSKSDLG